MEPLDVLCVCVCVCVCVVVASVALWLCSFNTVSLWCRTPAIARQQGHFLANLLCHLVRAFISEEFGLMQSFTISVVSFGVFCHKPYLHTADAHVQQTQKLASLGCDHATQT